VVLIRISGTGLAYTLQACAGGRRRDAAKASLCDSGASVGGALSDNATLRPLIPNADHIGKRYAVSEDLSVRKPNRVIARFPQFDAEQPKFRLALESEAIPMV
jgi:hypothetical protein